MSKSKEESITNGLDGVGTRVPGHDRHIGAHVIGSGLQSHPMHCGRTNPQHLRDTARELWPDHKQSLHNI